MMSFSRRFSLQSVKCGKKPPLRFDKPESIDGRAKTLGAGGYFLLAIPVTTFGLGVWQTKRRTWKLNLIRELEQKCQCEPVDLPNAADDIESMEYRKVRVRGKFDLSKEHYLGPKSLVRNDEDKEGGLFTTSSNTGFLVVAPFETSDQRRILVNRGWISKAEKDRRSKRRSKNDPENATVDGETLVGVLRRTESRPQFAPKNVLDCDTWTHRDVDALAEKLSAEAIFVDAVGDRDGIKGGQTRVTLRNEHFSYMLTWFSLSGATFYMWFKKFIRK